MGIAKMPVTPELLIDALWLPKDTEILGARLHWEHGAAVIEFIVQHDDILTDEVLPEFLTHYNENGEVEKIEFVSWTRSHSDH